MKGNFVMQNTENKQQAIPQVVENSNTENNTDTTPKNSDEITIPVKFNKEVKELTLTEATELAQKGLKFELILEDYERLRDLSRNSGKSVTQFLDSIENEFKDKRRKELYEKCGGDATLADHIIDLESKNANCFSCGIQEVKKYFPEIKEESDLPDVVTQSAQLKGTLLLDEYLRYLLNQKRKIEETEKIQKSARNASIGSQLNRKNSITPEAAEFLKGLWK